MKKPETLEEKTARLRALRLDTPAAARKPEDRSYPVLGMDDYLPFGKHQGKLLRDVIEADSDWILWALDTIVTFEVSDEAEAELDVVRDVRRPPRAWE